MNAADQFTETQNAAVSGGPRPQGRIVSWCKKQVARLSRLLGVSAQARTKVDGSFPEPTSVFGSPKMTRDSQAAIVELMHEYSPETRVSMTTGKDGGAYVAFEGLDVAAAREIFDRAYETLRAENRELGALRKAGKTAEADAWVAAKCRNKPGASR